MKRTVIGIACGLVLMNTLGCVIAVGDKEIEAAHRGSSASWEVAQTENRQKISNLVLSQSYNQLLELMGTPDFSEQFVHENKHYQVLYYRTHASGSKLNKADCTPLVFQNKSLVGWGNQALESIKAN